MSESYNKEKQMIELPEVGKYGFMIDIDNRTLHQILSSGEYEINGISIEYVLRNPSINFWDELSIRHRLLLQDL